MHGSYQPRPFAERSEAVVVLVPLALLAAALLAVMLTHDLSIVEGTSMAPTLATADRLLLSRDCDEPRRQDIIVFQEGDVFDGPTLVKRVVAVPGDVVLVLGDRVLVNGVPEPPHGMKLEEGAQYASLEVVPRGHVFVMGDNRPASLDSRIIGPVKISAIRGKVIAILGPLDRMRLTANFAH